MGGVYLTAEEPRMRERVTTRTIRKRRDYKHKHQTKQLSVCQQMRRDRRASSEPSQSCMRSYLIDQLISICWNQESCPRKTRCSWVEWSRV